MNELDWPMDQASAFGIVQRFNVALTTIEALDESQNEWSEAASTLRIPSRITGAIHNGIRSHATPAQMSGMFGDLTDVLPKALDAWGDATDVLYIDPTEWDVEADRRERLRVDFHTLRAWLYPEGQSGSA